jgi:endonuclease/exonuclease/phosphatase family metal-dependent hydrolase
MADAQPGEKDFILAGDFNLTPSILHEAISSADRTEGSGSTLNSKGEQTNNLYDHILVHDETATSEIIGNAVVLNRIGLASNPKVFYQTVSDHLPVVVRINHPPQADGVFR